MRVLICICCFLSLVSFADSCEEWFRESQLKTDPKCLEKCTVLPTGMDTFSCPLLCTNFCNERAFFEKLLGNLAYYSDLNVRERELIRLHPKEAITVFVQAQKAESSTYTKFGRDVQDDESDAYRHYIWAGLLSKELGLELAKKFLDAHEFERENEPNSAMDLANNGAGLLMSEQLQKTGRFSQEEMESHAMQALKEKSLVVLKPREGPK